MEVGLKLRYVVPLVRVSNIDKVIMDITVLTEVFAGANIHSPIYLARVYADDLPVHDLCQSDAELGLPGSRWSQNGIKQIRRKIIFHLIEMKYRRRAYHTTNLVHFSLLSLLATTFCTKAIPRTPSFTDGKSSSSGVGVLPSRLALTVAAKFL